jgi:hypothetical protein
MREALARVLRIVRLSAKGLLLRHVVCLATLSPLSSQVNADILTFCTGAQPDSSNQWARGLYNSERPGYLQSQFASGAVSLQGTQATTLQNQAQALTSIEGILKAPAAQVPSGADIGGLAFAAQVIDAQTTFTLSKLIGAKVSGIIPATNQSPKPGMLLVIGTSDVATVVSSSVDPQLIIDQLNKYDYAVKSITCESKEAPALLPAIPIALAAISIASTLANAFQPSLLAAAKTAGVQDPRNF